MGRFWVSAALLFAGVAGALATGGWHALSLAAGFVWHEAAWLLLALATLNLLRAVVPSGAIVGPAVFTTSALAVLIAQHHLSVHLSGPAAVAVGLALAACAVLVVSPSPISSAVAIGWVISKRPRHSIGPTISVIAILGVVRLDLRTAVVTNDEDITLRCLVLGGRIELRMPTQAEVKLSPDSSALLVRVSDDGAEPTRSGARSVRIRLLGAIGGFALRRG